jgi:hypothetical protein
MVAAANTGSFSDRGWFLPRDIPRCIRWCGPWVSRSPEDMFAAEVSRRRSRSAPTLRVAWAEPFICRCRRIGSRIEVAVA